MWTKIESAGDWGGQWLDLGSKKKDSKCEDIAKSLYCRCQKKRGACKICFGHLKTVPYWNRTTWRLRESDFQITSACQRKQCSKDLYNNNHNTRHSNGIPAYSVFYVKQLIVSHRSNLLVKLWFETIQAPLFSQIKVIETLGGHVQAKSPDGWERQKM